MKLGQGLSLTKGILQFRGPNALPGLELWLDSDYGVNNKLCANFINPNNEYLSFSTSIQLDGDFTLGGWYNAGTGILFGNTNNSNWIRIVGNSVQTRFSGVSINSPIGVISPSGWGFWIFRRTGNTFIATYNNQEVVQLTQSATFQINTLGAKNVTGGSPNYYQGQMDSVFITEEYLSDEIITAMYDNGNGISYNEASKLFTPTVDYWELNEVSGNRTGELGTVLNDNNTVGSTIGYINEPASDGDAVFQWLDKSGNSNHVTQSTFASQPLYNPDGLGTQSKPYLVFDGNDDYLDLTSAIDTTSDLTIFAVIQQDGDDSLVLGNDNENYFWLTGGTTNIYTSNRLGYDQYSSGETTSLILASATIGTAEDTITMYENSVSQAASWVNAADSLFDLLYVGRYKTSSYHGGKIAEIFVYNRILSTLELSNMHMYINNKYGIY